MRWSWLRAAMLGILLGPAPVPAASAEPGESSDPAESAESAESTAGGVPLPERETRSGRAVRGLDFEVWDEDPREATDWAMELLRAGGKIVESDRWRTVAARSAGRPAILTHEHEDDLATWIEASAPGAAPLGIVLCLLPGLDRTSLIAGWATSPNERIRRATAQALSAPFEAVGARVAIEHLQGDPSPEVRRLARSAAARRRGAPPLGAS